METRAEKLCPCLIGFDNIVYPKETLNKVRLTALHAICLQIFRHIAQKSVEKSDYASYAQALFSVSLGTILLICQSDRGGFLRRTYFFS